MLIETYIEGSCAGGHHHRVTLSVDGAKHTYDFDSVEILEPMTDADLRRYALYQARIQCGGKTVTEAKQILAKPGAK